MIKSQMEVNSPALADSLFLYLGACQCVWILWWEEVAWRSGCASEVVAGSCLAARFGCGLCSVFRSHGTVFDMRKK